MNEARDAEIVRRAKSGDSRVALAAAFGLKPERIQEIVVKDHYRQRRVDCYQAWNNFVGENLK